MTKQKIVIIGAGFGGLELACNLDKHINLFDITLISSNDKFVHYPTLYEQAVLKHTLFSNLSIGDIVSPDVVFLQDTVDSVNTHEKTIICKSGKKISYDKVVFSLGSVTADFGIPGVREYMYQFRTMDDVEKIRLYIDNLGSVTSSPIIIVGAGPTGIELASSIKNKLSENKNNTPVIIVEGSMRVAGQLPQKASNSIIQRLDSLNIQVLLNTRVAGYDGAVLKTGDQEIKSSCVIWTAGLGAHPLIATVSSHLDKRGRFMVNDFLQVTDVDDAYAIGDCASTPNSGLAQTAIHNAVYLSKHLVSLAQNKKIQQYKPHSVGYALPVGKNWGIAAIGPITFSGFLGYMIRTLIDYKYLIHIQGIKKAFKNILKIG